MTSTTTSPSEIQRASLFQLPELAHLCAATFLEKDDALFSRIIMPHANHYPNDTYRWWLRRSMVEYWDPRNYLMITTTTSNTTTKSSSSSDSSSSDSSTPSTTSKKHPHHPANQRVRITGFAHWTRCSARPRPLWHYPYIYVIQPIARLYSWAYMTIFPNRAASPEHEGILERSSILGAYLPAENWELNVMAVAPGSQGQGIGKRLVRWGIERAKAEGVSACVVSAPGKEGFYEKCGFGDSRVVRLAEIEPPEGERNEMREMDIPGGWFFSRDFGVVEESEKGVGGEGIETEETPETGVTMVPT